MTMIESTRDMLAKVGHLIRERGLSPEVRRMWDALTSFADATTSGDDAAIERVLRDQWLPVAGADPETAGMAHLALSMLSEDRGDVDGAVEQLRLAVDSLRQAGDDRNLPTALERLASAVEGRGDGEEAHRLRQEALPALRRNGDDRALLRMLGEVGRGLRQEGRLDEAERLAREELIPAGRRSGDDREVVECLLGLWAVLVDRGDHEAILALARDEILPLAARAEYAAGVATGAFAGAQALVGLGREAEAITWLRDVGVPAADHSDDPMLRVVVREHLGGLLGSTPRERAGARRILREALRICDDHGLAYARLKVHEGLRAIG